jgi:cytochrome P450
MDIPGPSVAAPRRLSVLPAPTGWPLIGHLHRMRPLQMHRQLEAWAQELGTPYRLRLGPIDVLVHDDPEVAQAVLRDRPHTIRRASVLRSVMREMGLDGVFSVEGEAWQPQRRLIMGALNVSHFRGFYPTLAAITARLHRRWSAAAERGAVVEMTEDLMRYTVDVTSALSFGEDPNTLDNPGHVIQQHLASIFPMLMKRTMAIVPHWRWLRLPADRALDRDLKAVHAYAHERIARARERMAADPSPVPRNALEAMLAQADVEGSGFTDEVVVANVLTLLLAGEDTTAHSLAWTMLFLAQRPALQQRLHGLAVSVLGAAPLAPVPDGYDAVKALEPFEGLALEALRFKPVVAFLGLEAKLDTVIGDVAVPKGTRYFFINRPAQLSGRHFGCPHEYKPERWSHGHGGAEAGADGAHDTRAFLQFGAGPRVCPGRHLATVEMRLVLAMLLRDFEIELACDPADIEEVLNFTNMPSRMPVRLKRRGAVVA